MFLTEKNYKILIITCSLTTKYGSKRIHLRKKCEKYELNTQRKPHSYNLQLSKNTRKWIAEKRKMNKQKYKKLENIDIDKYKKIITKVKYYLNKDKKRKINYFLRLKNSKETLSSPSKMWKNLKSFNKNTLPATNENVEHPYNYDYTDTSKCNYEEVTITWNEIYDTLKKMKNKKAESLDHIPQEVYKILIKDTHGESSFAQNILQLCNKILKENSIPKNWFKNFIVPLHKKGDKYNLNNYRGISIINTLSKLFFKIINTKVTEHIDKYNIINIDQTGFIQNQECVRQATTLIEIIQRRNKHDKETFSIFLDLAKAFDMVNHKTLFEKLQKYKINSFIINCFKNLYKNSESCVRINNKYTNFFKMEKGVRQGCPISPSLFNLYVNDFLENMEGITVPGIT